MLGEKNGVSGKIRRNEYEGGAKSDFLLEWSGGPGFTNHATFRYYEKRGMSASQGAD